MSCGRAGSRLSDSASDTEAPLLDTTQSIVGSNIDARQMTELPVQGRPWAALAPLAPGNRTTAIGENPAQDRSDVREFQSQHGRSAVNRRQNALPPTRRI